MNALDRLMDAATAAGCPADQMLNFRKAGYVPQPKQLLFHAAARSCDFQSGPETVGLGGSRGPGKSHATLAQIALDDCQRMPGLKVLFLRKVGHAARESFEDLITRVLKNILHEYIPTRSILEFPNGSRIILGGFKDEKDIDRYLGIEYDVIVLEEATQLSHFKFQMLTGSLRTSKPDWKPRLYSTTNPGGVGHAWYRSMYVNPYRNHTEGYTRFIPSTIDDNAFVDEGYVKKLERLTGWLKRAWRYGDWDIAAGQFFTPFRYETHVIRDYVIPPSQEVWLSMDYGLTHWNMVYLLTINGDGEIVTVDEHGAQGWVPSKHVVGIYDMLDRNKVNKRRINKFVAGADVFSKRVSDKEATTIATMYANPSIHSRGGFHITKAHNDRITGAAELMRRLGDIEEEIYPSFYITENCPRLIECIPMLEHDPSRPEDVLGVDTDDESNGGDDPYDAIRYGIMEKARGVGQKMPVVRKDVYPGGGSKWPLQVLPGGGSKWRNSA